MESADIFAEAIRQGSSNSQEEVKRDLASLLTLVSDANSFSNQVELLLAGNTSALAWLTEIKILSQASVPPIFGPVLATESGATERLSLGVLLRNSLQTKSDVKNFVEASNADLLDIFSIAKQTQKYLSNFVPRAGERLWVLEFTPAFLQKTLENQLVLRNLAVAATGGDLSTEWKDMKSWVDSWTIPRNKVPQRTIGDGGNPGGDGFFEPQYANYQPAAVHPLVLGVLRESFLNQLNGGGSQKEIQAFCQWLVARVFDGNLLDAIKLESVFAAGSLILALAKQQEVTIQENGQLAVPTMAVFWGDLSERVLKTIVNNSQQLDNVPTFWKDTQVEVRQLLYSCPEWHSTPLINNLRNRATKLLGEELEILKTVILRESSKLAEDKFKPEVELSSQSALLELRPKKSIDTISPEREDYFKKLDRLNSQIADISSFNSVIQKISTKAAQGRDAFKQRLVSPLAEPALPALTALSFEEINLPLATYLQQQVSQISLDSKLVRSGNLIQETLANQPAWMGIINQTATTDDQVLSNWSKLDIWDGLRGRLAQPSGNEGDRNVTQYLSQQLPDWLQNDTIDPPVLDLDAIRPILAELTHLGISLQIGTYQLLTERLESLINRDDLDDALKALLAAMRLELGLTAIASGTVPGQSFKQFNSPSKALFEEFAGWIQRSIESSNAWESRAGMNALILLARLAEGTGDLLINSAIQTAMPSGSRASRLVSQSVNQLFSTGSKGAGLPLAFAGFDLARYAREATLSIAPQISASFVPVWAPQPISGFLDRLTDRLGTATRATLETMVAEGGIGLKVILLSLLQIKLDELDWERQLIVRPLRRNASPKEADLRHNVILKQVEDLQKAIRFVFCREQLFLNELPEVSGEIKPWWQIRYWLASPSNSSEDGQLSRIGSIKSTLTLISALEEASIPSEIQTLLGELSGQATVSSILKRQRWLILDPQNDPQTGGSNKTYLIEQSPGAAKLRVYRAANPFLLINWTASYSNNVEVSLLSLAASLVATVPVVSEDNPQDTDGRYEGEFPDLSWKATTNNLQTAVRQLEKYENDYKAALQEQINGDRAAEIINLLKQPLLLNTADYKEQMLAAIAEVREAEADLEVAEFESLATQFEVFANQMLYEAADVEVQRQSTLVEVSKLDEGIAQLEREADGIRKSQASTSVDITKRDVELAKNVREKALKESEKVKIARKAILREIDLLKSLLEKPTEITIDGKNITAKGQIGAMAYKVEATLIKQLNENLETARIELKKAQDAEAERKKREKRRKLVSGICRFVGAVVGSIYGGPAGAALGAEIGGAIGELANGVIENKAPEEILLGLVDNGFAIAQAAGVDLEKELNTLGSKGAAQVTQFFDRLESSLEPLLDSLPKILDEQLVKDAIVVLDLQEVPVLTKLLEKSYGDLKRDIPNLGQLGTVLKAIQYDSPRDFLNHLSDNLFKNTKGNVEEIKALSQAIGKKVEDLQTDEGLKEAAERFAKLVVTRVGQEAVNFRQDAIATWIRNKRDKAQWWNGAVQKEAEGLVKELFPDVQSQAEVMANLESSLINPEIIRGELQVHLDPWQKELDKRIGEITAVDDKNSLPPPSAVAAAEQSVKYLEICIDKFNKSLLPWLKGEGNTQRTQLLLDLNKLQTEKLPTSDIDLKIREIDEANALLSEGNAKAALENMEKELVRVGLLYKAANLKVSKATLLNKVADLAKLRAANLKGAQENSLKASEKRQRGAQAKVKSAQFNLEAKRALSQGAARRGAEASRIRGTLSQPALRLPNLAANSTSSLRIDYVTQLNYAFKAYRELLRYYYAAFSVVAPSLQKIPVLNRDGSWSKNFTGWQRAVGDSFSSPNDPSQASGNFKWDLTPQQIKSLFSPEGFKLVIAPHVEERLVLFNVPQEWQIYLDQLNRLNTPIKDDEKSLIKQLWRPGFNKLWIQEFRKNGIMISDRVSIKTEGAKNWRIEDLQTEPIEIAFLPEGSVLPVKWDIQRSVSYSVTRETDRLFITLRPSPEDIGQSDFNDRHFKNIDASEARTGRVAAIFLTGKVKGSTTDLEESDYAISVSHLGDIWTTNSATKVKVQLRKQRTLQDQRDFFIPPKTDLETRLNTQQLFFAGQGDPDIFGVQGNPLSGTTVIKLKPKGGASPPFESLKLQVLYTFWT